MKKKAAMMLAITTMSLVAPAAWAKPSTPTSAPMLVAQTSPRASVANRPSNISGRSMILAIARLNGVQLTPAQIVALRRNPTGPLAQSVASSLNLSQSQLQTLTSGRKLTNLEVAQLTVEIASGKPMSSAERQKLVTGLNNGTIAPIRSTSAIQAVLTSPNTNPLITGTIGAVTPKT